MRGSNTWKTALLAAMLVAVAGCTNDSLDDGSAADVILEIVSFENPAVNAQRTQATEGTCFTSGVACQSNLECGTTDTCVRLQICLLEVEDWSVTLMNTPKNPSAIGPYNDVIMQNVEIAYAWLNAGLTTPNAVVPLGNVVIPAQGQSAITFAPIATDVLSAAFEGATANLTLTFVGRTVEGTTIRQTTGRQLAVEVCN